MADTKNIKTGGHAMDVTPIDKDFHGWLLGQAALLRNEQYGLLDRNNLAEELEAMAARDRRTMRKQLKRLLAHLLKYLAQSEATDYHESWRRTIRNARQEISDMLKESPGIFQGKEDEVFSEAYGRAREDASDETHLPLGRFPEYCIWTFQQALSDESLIPPRYDTDNPA